MRHIAWLIMATPRPLLTVLEGSELDGPEPDVATWAGLEVPEARWDDYVELFADVEAVATFFGDLEHAVIEATDEDDAEQFWRISSEDPSALRQEVRDKLIRALALDLDLSRKLLALVRAR